MSLAAFPTYEKYNECDVDWIDVVPQTWSIKRLKHVAAIKNNKTSSKNHPARYLGMENVESWSGRIIDGSSEVEGLANCFSEGDILFGKLRPYLAKVTQPNFMGLCSSEFIVLSARSEIESAFLAHCLRSSLFINYINASTYGSKMPRANPSFVANSKLLLPPLPEQRAIAAFLDNKCEKIDEAVRIKEAQIALLRERRQILIQEAVTRGLNPDAPMKDSGIDWIGQIPAHWDAVPLKRLFFENTRRTQTGKETLLSLRMQIGLVPHDDVSDKPITDADLIDYKIVEVGQLVMNRMRASIGLFGIALQDGLVSPDYAIFDARQDLFAPFFLSLFKMEAVGTRFRLSSRGLGTGSSGFMRLYTDDFGAISVPLPPRDEQEDIVRYIEATSKKIGGAITLKQDQITALKEYKTSLINAAVTGKIKVI